MEKGENYFQMSVVMENFKEQKGKFFNKVISYKEIADLKVLDMYQQNNDKQ